MSKIKALIFDFGDVFINLDKQGAIERGKILFAKDIITEAKNDETLDIFNTNNTYEKGLIPTKDFVSFYTNLSDKVSSEDFINLWNSLIKDFPKYRLDWLQNLKNQDQFKFILLSNTNELHINYVKETVPFYEAFKSCFDAFYLSHEIHLTQLGHFGFINGNFSIFSVLFILI